MYGQKKIDVFKDHNSMGITFNWYTPAAFFFAFFAAFWNTFLVVWYSMAFMNDAPLLFKLFPIIHVAIGLYLIYYTVCLFANRTYIDVGDGYLTVEHRPIPWWRGNKEILTKDIQQLYVKEKITQNKNSRTYSYDLWANLANGKKEKLMSGNGLTSLEMQEIEEYLEQFMGINDVPVRGEYAKRHVLQKQVDRLPRRHRRDILSSEFQDIYETKKRDYLDFRNESLELISITQLDWKDGNSDKILQFVDDNDKETLIYMQQNRALLSAFAEKSVSFVETRNINFLKNSPPDSMMIEGKVYFLQNFKTGEHFLPGVFPGMEVEQWWYLSNNQDAYIRVVDCQELLSFHQGNKLDISDFQKGLDLNDLPKREKEIRGNSWDEQDLV